MKKGTPAGTQLDCGVKALFLPARISSMSFFIRSLTHGFRFGLVRSAMRKVGCLPTPLGTNGWAGSLTTGPGRRPGTGSKNGPPPLKPTQPAKFDEKSGGGACCCAGAGAASGTTMRPASIVPATTAPGLAPYLIPGIVASPLHCCWHAALVACGQLQLEAPLGGRYTLMPSRKSR